MIHVSSYKYFFTRTPFQITRWDFFIVLGWCAVIICSLILKHKYSKKIDLSNGQILGLISIMSFFGLLGAKALYFLLHWDKMKVLMKYNVGAAIEGSGQAFFGAFVFLMISMAAFTKFRKTPLSFLKTGDFIFPIFFLGHAIGRIGCFFNACCYGTYTSLPWGCVFPGRGGVPLHPTQLYEALVLFIIFVLAIYRYFNNKWPPGIIMFGCFLFYGVFRFFNEFIRGENINTLYSITAGQIGESALVVLSSFIIAMIFIHNKKTKTTI